MKIASKIRIGTESKVKPRKTCGRIHSKRIKETKRQAPTATWERFGLTSGESVLTFCKAIETYLPSVPLLEHVEAFSRSKVYKRFSRETP